MNPWIAAAWLGLAAIFTTMPLDAQERETLEWLDDYDEAIRVARETGRPLLVEFRCAP